MVVSDDAGGAFVVSSDLVCFGHAHCAGNSTDLRAHHVTPSGTIGGWPDEGVPLGSGVERSFDRRQGVSISNGFGSVLTTWADPVGDYHYLSYGGDLRAQRVDVTGALPWGPNGVLIRSTLFQLFNQTMAPDGDGGSYVFWQDDRSPGIYGQHVDADGHVLWPTDGIPVARAPMTNVGPPVAVSDGSHGAIIAWSGTSGGLSGIFAARVTPGGVIPQPQGQFVYQAGDAQVDGLRIVPAQSGAIIAWRSVQQGASDKILAQQLDHAAHPRWSSSAVTVCGAQGTRDHLALAADDRGGAYLAWVDSRPDFSIYGTHLDRSGERIEGWSVDGEPISARIPLETPEGGTATVSELALTTLDGAPSAASSSDTGPDQHQAGAMLVWVDDRTGFSTFSVNSPFAMLLTPHGPAAPATSASTHRVSLNPGAPSQPAPSPAVLSLSIAPSRTDLVRVQLPDASSASLELFDLAGRKLWARDVGNLGPGAHDVPLLDTARLPSGVYMARLHDGAQVSSVRFAILH
jgi:hypothetical protein